MAAVNEFLQVEKEDDAFDTAYKFVALWKWLNWSHEYEKLMLISIDLAVKLGKFNFLPENLLNFKAIALVAQTSSLETVLNFYLKWLEDHFL